MSPGPRVTAVLAAAGHVSQNGAEGWLHFAPVVVTAGVVTAPDGWGMAWEEEHGGEAGSSSIQSVDIRVFWDCLFGSCVQLKGRAPIILTLHPQHL